jgi:hypothetical protein
MSKNALSGVAAVVIALSAGCGLGSDGTGATTGDAAVGAPEGGGDDGSRVGANGGSPDSQGSPASRSADAVAQFPPDASGGAPDASPHTPCANDGQCPPPTPFCNLSLGFCVACLADKDCGGDPRPFCSPSTHSCVECTSNADCAARDGRPLCDISTESCVECVTAADCGDGGLSCDVTAHTCAPSCNSSADCAQSSSGPVCDPAFHACVPCIDDSTCQADTPYCDTSTDRCVQCLTSTNCGDAGPCANGMCSGSTGN